ncbi:MAG: hypothetical protein ACTSRL_03975 [Candidatus Helarchaeota archaeon]
MEANNLRQGIITNPEDFELVSTPYPIKSCKCGYFSDDERFHYCPCCGAKLKIVKGKYFEVHLRPDTTGIKNRELKNFIEKVINPYWEIGLIKCDEGFRIIDSTEIWKGEISEFASGELIPFKPTNPNEPR